MNFTHELSQLICNLINTAAYQYEPSALFTRELHGLSVVTSIRRVIFYSICKSDIQQRYFQIDESQPVNPNTVRFQEIASEVGPGSPANPDAGKSQPVDQETVNAQSIHPDEDAKVAKIARTQAVDHDSVSSKPVPPDAVRSQHVSPDAIRDQYYISFCYYCQCHKL